MLRWCIHCQDFKRASSPRVAELETTSSFCRPNLQSILRTQLRLTGFTYAFQLTWCGSLVGRFFLCVLSGGEEETLQQFGARRTSSTHCSGHAKSLYLSKHLDFFFFVASLLHQFCAPLRAAHHLHWASLDTQPVLQQQISSSFATLEVPAPWVSHKWAGHIEVSSAKDSLQTTNI